MWLSNLWAFIIALSTRIKINEKFRYLLFWSFEQLAIVAIIYGSDISLVLFNISGEISFGELSYPFSVAVHALGLSDLWGCWFADSWPLRQPAIGAAGHFGRYLL